MDRSEKALASLLADDEQLCETWSVDTINKGFSMSPPGMGPNETLGLTDRRLVWLDEELETIDLDDIRAIEATSVDRSSAPVVVVLGSIAIVLGIIATPLLWLFASLPIEQTLAPLALGIVLYLLSSVITAIRTDGEEVDRQHYLEVRTARTTAQVYDSKATVEEMLDRIEAQRADDSSAEEREPADEEAESAT